MRPGKPANTRGHSARALLQNSFVTINAGAVDQPFSQDQLQPGFQAASIAVPRAAVRVMLFRPRIQQHTVRSGQLRCARELRHLHGRQRRGPGSHHVRVNWRRHAQGAESRLPVECLS